MDRPRLPFPSSRGYHRRTNVESLFASRRVIDRPGSAQRAQSGRLADVEGRERERENGMRNEGFREGVCAERKGR